MIDPVDGLTRPLPVHSESPIRQHFVSADSRHTALLTRDLFGDWIVMQAWSSKRNRRGGGKTHAVDNFDAGLAALASIAKIRRQRGYQLVD
ncbi:hypothetical protein [Actimicrobium antarcticum]|uniref:WGR domain-containing protein n=1 Tax=Actimicrobium antarcticum TaxID=1051899 RepID=A0ABP7TIE6_9BURK